MLLIHDGNLICVHSYDNCRPPQVGQKIELGFSSREVILADRYRYTAYDQEVSDGLRDVDM
jgi:hypothetical protein